MSENTKSSEHIRISQSARQTSVTALLSRLMSWYRNRPNWQKTAFERAAASIFILIIISHLATYYYAIIHGARLPLEGVPFLILVSITCSIVLTFFSLITLLMLPLGREETALESKRENLNWLERNLISPWVVARRNLREAIEQSRSKPRGLLLVILIRTIIREKAFARLIAVIYAFGATFAALVLSVQSFENFFSSVVGGSLVEGINASQLLLLLFSLILALVFVSISIGRSTKATIRRVSRALYLGAVALVASQMFGSTFDQILRASRYGGGIEVTILMRDDEIREERYLFLVSSDTMTIWDRKDNSFEAINSSQVISTIYMPNSPHAMPVRKSFGYALLQ